MSEESKRSAEISETELANVSGGIDGFTHYSTESEVQAFLCNHCPVRQSPTRCSGSAAQVVKYLQKHARAIIHGPRECPFYQG